MNEAWGWNNPTPKHDAFWIWYLVGVGGVAGFIALSVVMVKSRTRSSQVEWLKAETEDWNKLGITAEERRKSINQIFDRKLAILRVASKDWVASSQRFDLTTGLWVRISRSLAVMNQRERECLRATYLLFNEGKISRNRFRYFCFSFIHGDGKASIDLVQGDDKMFNSIERDFKNQRYTDDAVNRLLQDVGGLAGDASTSEALEEFQKLVAAGGLAPPEKPAI